MDQTRRSSSTFATLLWAVQLVVAIAAVLLVYFRRMEIPHCDLQCDFRLLDATGHVFTGVAIGLFVLVGVIQFLVPGKPKWWLPIIGITLTIAGGFVASHLSDAALRLV